MKGEIIVLVHTPKSFVSFSILRTDLDSTHREELKSALKTGCNHREGGATTKGMRNRDFRAVPDVRRDPLAPAPSGRVERTERTMANEAREVLWSRAA